MKKVLFVFLAIVAGAGIYWFYFREKKTVTQEEKVAALKVSKHTAAFNGGIDSLLNAYFQVKDAFVDADTTLAKTATRQLITLADSSKLAELKNDNSGIYETAAMQMNDIKLNAESLVQQKDITEMRQDFRMIGENIYPLLKTIHYEGKILYWQNCPMAFGEDKGANWLSSSARIVNPYLGKNHPEFKGSMLHCGEVKDSIKAQ